MKEYGVLIIGGGAAGLIAAVRLARRGIRPLVLEQNDRLGKKLAASGNGQGNLTNARLSPSRYHGAADLAARLIARYGVKECREFYESVGCLTAEGKAGRIYPASFQASSVADCLRFALSAAGGEVRTSCRVLGIGKRDGEIAAETDSGAFRAPFAVAAFGGAAAGKTFGTDGSSFRLLASLGHTVTPLSPSLVRLVTDREFLKGLKGVRVDAVARAERAGETIAEEHGDAIFSDFGVSGSAAMAVSAAALLPGAALSLEFLPDVTREELTAALAGKIAAYPSLPAEELFCGILHKSVGRSILRAAGIPFSAPVREIGGRADELAAAVKHTVFAVRGSTGLEDAQVTRGGIPASEVTDELESRLCPGLFLAGELLDVDGDCGGFNLHWAFASASRAADAIAGRTAR